MAVEDGDALGACYLYSKTHSYGEYIFDWSWAQAYERYQMPYYPKLLSAVPFTPATGPKLLFKDGVDKPRVAAALIASALEQMEAAQHHSLHYLFITPDEIPYFEAAGFSIRHSFQYHWKNEGYTSFEEYLGKLKSKKRKQIERERQQLGQEGLTFRAVTGEALLPEHAELFYRLYLSTILKMGAIAYLTEDFYRRVFAAMHDQIILFLAEDRGEVIAGSLCYFKGDALFGRYWGAVRDVRNLHFELCYYRPIEWAIAHKLARFEAGAQGEHKHARGFLPTRTYSAHWIRHPQFRVAIGNFIDEEKAVLASMFEDMKVHSPFR